MTTVLVVDDESEVRDLVQYTLEDYDLRSASSGDEALSAVAASLPDVVVMDIMMPGTTGLQVLELWRADPVTPGARTEEGLVVYRFGTSLYYANASRLLEDVKMLVGHGGPLRWIVSDCAAIGDVDYTASAVLVKVVEHVHQHHVHLVFSSVLGPVRQQLDRYGISKALGQDAYFETPGEALEAFHSAVR